MLMSKTLSFLLVPATNRGPSDRDAHIGLPPQRNEESVQLKTHVKKLVGGVEWATHADLMILQSSKSPQVL